MKLIDYVYQEYYSSPNWITGENAPFKSKEEIYASIPMGNCPNYFLEDVQFYKPIKKGTDCSVATKSEKTQKKVCTECWNREYVSSSDKNDEYELYLKLKQKYEN